MSFVEIPGYNIRYDKNRALTMLRLMSAIPKILIRIKQENRWLRAFAEQERPDLVISDNRYGLALRGIPCVLMTHQLLIRTSLGMWADRLVQKFHYRVIGRFSRCWVPDVEMGDGLAGMLSHPRRMPTIPTKYIGWLSRFGEGDGQGDGGVERSGTDRDVAGPDGSVAGGPVLLVLLSGPEPQRSLLEARILSQAGEDVGGLVIVRGLPEGGKRLPVVPAGGVVYDHLPAAQLERLVRSAGFVVARPGYSTVMDLARLGKRALFIPTPGQTEQEYLGVYLAGKGLASCVEQRAFSLAEARSLAAVNDGPRLTVTEASGLLRAEIVDLLERWRAAAQS